MYSNEVPYNGVLMPVSLRLAIWNLYLEPSWRGCNWTNVKFHLSQCELGIDASHGKSYLKLTVSKWVCIALESHSDCMLGVVGWGHQLGIEFGPHQQLMVKWEICKLRISQGRVFIYNSILLACGEDQRFLRCWSISESCWGNYWHIQKLSRWVGHLPGSGGRSWDPGRQWSSLHGVTWTVNLGDWDASLGIPLAGTYIPQS